MKKSRNPFRFLTSKTVWAGIIGAASKIAESADPRVATILQGVAMILGAVGVRDAIAQGPDSTSAKK